MKKLICVLMLGACVMSSSAQDHTRRQRGEQVKPSVEKTDAHRRGDTKGATKEGARLRLDHTTHNFGDIHRKGGDLTHDFRVFNDGTTPLVITRVITSCSCIKASFPKRPIAPGASDVIRITYEPLKSEPGTFNKVIQVYSNSVDGRSMLTVQGNSIDPNKK